MANPKVYDCNEVSIVYGGQLLRSGRGKEAFLKIEQVVPEKVESAVGCDGEVAVSKIHNKLCKISITCMQTSGINDTLQAILSVRDYSPNSVNAKSLTVRDRSGNMNWEGTAWLSDTPSIERGKSLTEVEWLLGGIENDANHGGNV